MLYSVYTIGGKKLFGERSRGVETQTGTQGIRKTYRKRNVFTLPDKS